MFLDKTKVFCGNKAKVGNTVIVDDGKEEKIGVFVGYSPCCGKRKVLMSRSEAREFSTRYRSAQSSVKQTRLNKRLDEHLSVIHDVALAKERESLQERLYELETA